MSPLGYHYYHGMVRYTYETHKTLSLAKMVLTRPKIKFKNIRELHSNVDTSLNEEHIEPEMGEMQQYHNIFKNSEFQLLRVSEHGSLVQVEDKETSYFGHEMLGYPDEEELRYTEGEDIPKFTAILNNPNETRIMKRIRRNGRKITPESFKVSWYDFQQNVICDEKVIKDYDFQPPIFPEEVNLFTLKRFLKSVNSISYEYDTKGYQGLIYHQMKEIKDNLNKFDGMLDIEIMHEFIKFFGNFTEQLQIFKILKKFEFLGILPNKDTLDLIIYKLNMMPQNQRSFWLELYLQLGTNEWNVVTDLRTRALVCMLLEPSKKRLSTFKALINEGVQYEILKWHYIDDFLSVEVERKKFNFDKIFSKLIGKDLGTADDKLKTYQSYIKLLAQKKYSIIAINHVLVNNELETSDCWAALVEALISSDKIWEAYAVFNHARDRKIDLKKLVVIFLQHRKKVYLAFGKLEDLEKEQIFLQIEKYLISLCGASLDLNEKIVDSFETIRLDSKSMSNFIEKSVNQMDQRALLREVEKRQSQDLEIDKNVLPWK